MAVIAVQNFTGDTAVDFTTAAASAGGDTVQCGNSAGGWHMPTILLVFNAGGGAITVTVTLPSGTVIGPTSVGATTGRTAIRLSGQPLGAVAAVAYSGVTSVTVAALRTWIPSP